MSSTKQPHHHHHHHLQAPAPAPAPAFVAPARPFVLVPLYIYPAPGAWEPLRAAAEARPELEFWAVVNPANGPGAGALPDANYERELARLTALRNVRVVGYVHCSYGRRAAEDIVADVEAYGRWEGEMIAKGVEGESIVVDGIFIDEVPSSTEFVEYMASLASAIKTILNRSVLVPNKAALDGAAASLEKGTASGEDEGVSATASTAAAEARLAEAEAPPAPPAPARLADATTPPPTTPPPPGGALTPVSSSTAVVIYNPGVVVDPIFYQAADYVVAFENAAAAWQLPAVRQGLSRLPRALLPRSVVIAHSAAGGAAGVARASRRAAEAGCVGQFVTGKGGYTEWCPDWMEFVGEMAGRTLI